MASLEGAARITANPSTSPPPGASRIRVRPSVLDEGELKRGLLVDRLVLVDRLGAGAIGAPLLAHESLAAMMSLDPGSDAIIELRGWIDEREAQVGRDPG